MFTLKSYFLVLILLIFMVPFAGVNAQDYNDIPHPIKIAIFDQGVPYSLEDNDGKPAGLLVDIWKKWSEVTGVPVEFVISDWGNTIENIKNKQADIHFGLAYSKEREKWLDYSTPVHSISGVLYSPVSQGNVESIEYFYGKKIGVNRGGIAVSIMKEDASNIKIVEYDGFQNLTKALFRGEIDAFVADRLPMNDYLRNQGKIGAFNVNPKLIYKETLFSAVRKGNDSLNKLIRSGFKRISIEELHEIEARWIADHESHYYKQGGGELSLTDEEKVFLSKHPIVRVQNEHKWPPFNYREGDQPKGFSIDYMKLLASKLEIQVEFVSGPTWSEFIEMLKDHRLDMMVNMVKTPERTKFAHFTSPFIELLTSVVTKKETKELTNLANLKGKRLAVVKGFYQVEILKKHYPEIPLVYADNALGALEMVVSGQADAAIATYAIFNYLIQKHFFTDLVNFSVKSEKFFKAPGMRIGVRSDWNIFRNILQKSMDAVTEDEMIVLRRKWFGETLKGDSGLQLNSEEKSFLRSHKPFVFSNIEWEPLFIGDESGKYEGIIADYLHLISERSELKFIYEKSATESEVLEKYEEAKIDMIPLVEKDRDLERSILTTNSYISFPMVIITKDDVSYIKGAPFLNGEKVAVKRGGESYLFLKNNYPEVVLIDVENESEGLLKVSTGQVFAFVGHMAVVLDAMKRSGLESIHIAGTTEYLFKHQIGLGSQYPEAISIMNKVIDGISHEEHQKIYQKWLTVKYEQAFDYALLWKLTVVFTFIILFVVFWNLKLSKFNKHLNIEVAERRRAERVQGALYRIAHAVGTVEGINDFFKTIHSIVGEFMDARNFYIALYDKELGEVSFPYFFDEYDVAPGARPLKKSFTDYVIRTGESLFKNEESKNRLVSEGSVELAGALCIDWLGVPIKHEGDVFAVLAVQSYSEKTQHTEKDMEFLISVSHYLGVAFERVRLLEESRESEKRFKDMADMLPQPIYEMDLEGNLTYTNKQGRDFIGDTESGTEQDIINVFSLLHIDDHGKAKEFIKEILEQGKNCTTEYRFRKIDGSVVPVITHSSPLYDAGKIVGIRGVLIDISEQRKIEEAIRAADRAKSEFLANMSHEIRTPMNAIVGLSDLALQTSLSDQQRDYLTKIDTSSKTLLNIINDILDFTKIEAGKLELETIDFSLQKVLDNVVSMVNYQASNKQLELLCYLASDVPNMLKGDPLRLGQVLLNLASNAVKFTNSGEVIIRGELMENSSENSACIQFSVQDTGIGMKEEYVKTLFKSFTQADSSTTRQFGGTGLGLTISKELVEMMGGDIIVESQFGEGSVFRFTVCFEKGAESKFPAIQGLKALIVDDNEAARIVLSHQLESFSIQSTQVESVKDALKKIQNSDEGAYDIVFMDWKMPETNGIEGTRQLRELLPEKKVPAILMVTAYNLEDAREEAEDAGVDGFLTKPVNPSLLYDAIQRGRGANTLFYENQTESIANKESLHMLGSKALLVEDNEINTQVATEFLTQMGLEVTVAENGQCGLDILKENQFDVILMDIQMPVMDGYEATQCIREMGIETPIIAMTAHAFKNEIEKCLQVGMNAHISKPIDRRILRNTLSEWIKVQPAKGVDDECHLPLEIDGLNIKNALALSGGNHQLFLKMAGSFVRNREQMIKEIEGAINANDIVVITRFAHSLKGVGGSFGADVLSQIGGDVEVRLKDDAEMNESIKSKIIEMVEELNRVFDVLESLLNDANDDQVVDKVLDPEETLKALYHDLLNENAAFDVHIQNLNQAFPEKVYSSILELLFEMINNADFGAARDVLKSFSESLSIDL